MPNEVTSPPIPRGPSVLGRAAGIRTKKLPEPARSHQQRQIPGLGSVQISRSALRGRPEAKLSHDVAPAPLQVEECTRQVLGLIPDQLKGAPNAKLFLRSFWYRCLLAGLVAQEEMHLYTLSRCATASYIYMNASMQPQVPNLSSLPLM